MRQTFGFVAFIAAPLVPAQGQVTPAPPVPVPNPAPNPSPNTDVIRAADDAFGRRIGIEDVGLYSESEVRGFDLQSAGNYRIDDHYFVRTHGIVLPMIQGTTIRVGANGLRTDFAAPSGVMQYNLPRGRPGAQASVETGWWGGSGPIVMTRIAAGTADERLTLAGGVQLGVSQRYTDGTNGEFISMGLVPRWRPAPGVTLTGAWSANWYPRGGSTTYASTGAAPPELKRNTRRVQPWMNARNTSDLLGAMADVEAGKWTFRASLFRSILAHDYNSFHLIRFSDAADGAQTGRTAEASGLLYGDEWRRGVSAELTAARRFSTGRLDHRVMVMARRRDSLVLADPGAAFTLGRYPDINNIPALPRPKVALRTQRLRDTVKQWTGGIGYRLSIGNAAELRVDAQRVEYKKALRGLDGVTMRETTRTWLYGGALSIALSPALTGFASYARGLEESGVAPAVATNRGEVLTATISRQAELGLKYAVPGGPSVIAGLFDLSKPLAGIDAAGAYGFVGTVRHRGAELSLAGPVTPRLNVVLGATWLHARTTGELVERGVIGPRPIGKPEWMGLANLTWRVPWLEGLAIDGGVTLRSGRPGDRENRVMLPGYALFSAGLRQRVKVNDTPITIRARVANLTDRFVWLPTSAGLYTPNSPRVFTLTATVEL